MYYDYDYYDEYEDDADDDEYDDDDHDNYYYQYIMIIILFIKNAKSTLNKEKIPSLEVTFPCFVFQEIQRKVTLNLIESQHLNTPV